MTRNQFAKQFGQWFLREFLKWQMEANEVRSSAEFAKWLGISAQDASRYKRGIGVPGGERLRQIADKLGWEAYDAAGVPRPTNDVRLEQVILKWDSLTEDLREAIYNLLLRGAALNVLREGKGKKDGRKNKADSS